jgi:hypothetical protein
LFHHFDPKTKQQSKMNDITPHHPKEEAKNSDLSQQSYGNCLLG